MKAELVRRGDPERDVLQIRDELGNTLDFWSPDPAELLNLSGDLIILSAELLKKEEENIDG